MQEGDDSWRGVYNTVPYGAADKITTQEKALQLNRLHWLNEIEGTLPAVENMSVVDANKYEQHSWEFMASSDLVVFHGR